MSTRVKPDYVNPLTTMKNIPGNPRKSGPAISNGASDAQSRLLELQMKKQSIQNTITMLKSSSGDVQVPPEQLKNLDSQLEDVNKELRSSEMQAAQRGEEKADQQSAASAYKQAHSFDRYEKEGSFPIGYEK